MILGDLVGTVVAAIHRSGLVQDVSLLTFVAKLELMPVGCDNF